MITILLLVLQHDHSIHKNVLYLSLYKDWTMIAVLKMTAIVLTKCLLFEFLWGLRPWS